MSLSHKASKKIILRALINFHYVTFLLISIKKYLTHNQLTPKFSMQMVKLPPGGSQGAVRGQSGGSRGQSTSDTEDFLTLMWFLPPGGKVGGSPLITKHSTDTEVFRALVDLGAVGAVGAHFLTSRFYKNSKFEIYKNFEIYKFWNWNECDFVIFENVAKNDSFTPDVSLCSIA